MAGVTLRHIHVSRVALCDRHNTFASFSEDDFQVSWQAQHFRRDVCCAVCQSRWQGCITSWHCENCVAGVGHSESLLCALHSTLHTLHFMFYTSHFTLDTPHSTLYTPHSTVYTPHSALYTPHFTLDTPHSRLYTLHPTLYTLHFALCTLHFTPRTLYTLDTPHSTLYTSHSTLCTPHSTLDTPHSTVSTPHSTVCTPHFTLYTLYSILCTLHFTLHTLHLTLHTLHLTLHTPDFTPYTLHSTLHTLHFALYILHLTLYIHLTLHTLHFTLHTLHFVLHDTLYAQNFTLLNPHSTPYTLHSPLNTPLSSHSTLCTPLHSTLHNLHRYGNRGRRYVTSVPFTYVWAFEFVGCILFVPGHVILSTLSNTDPSFQFAVETAMDRHLLYIVVSWFGICRCSSWERRSGLSRRYCRDRGLVHICSSQGRPFDWFSGRLGPTWHLCGTGEPWELAEHEQVQLHCLASVCDRISSTNRLGAEYC